MQIVGYRIIYFGHFSVTTVLTVHYAAALNQNLLAFTDVRIFNKR